MKSRSKLRKIESKLRGWFHYWLFPLGIRDALRFLRVSLAFHLDRNMGGTVKPNRKFKGKYKGRRCFILATGPSIQEQDLNSLRAEICFAVNNFFVHKDFSVINPEYYCIAPLHPPFTEEDGVRWLEEMNRRMKERTFFLGLSDKALVERNRLLKEQEIYYLAFNSRSSFVQWNPYLTDLAGPLPPQPSVTLIAITVAIYMGFSEIYLLGVDHSFPFHMGESRHFYKETERKLGEDSYKAHQDNQEFFLQMAELFNKYKILRKNAESKGIRIVNATPGSLLDVFEMEDLHAVLEKGQNARG